MAMLSWKNMKKCGLPWKKMKNDGLTMGESQSIERIADSKKKLWFESTNTTKKNIKIQFQFAQQNLD
jgi:hypothetical protein